MSQGSITSTSSATEMLKIRYALPLGLYKTS